MHTRDKGNKAEDMVADALISKGHIIVERNVYGQKGEIDIVSIKDKTLYIYEVKSLIVHNDLEDHIDPLGAIDKNKIQRIKSVFKEKLWKTYCSFSIKIYGVRVLIFKHKTKITFVEVI